MTENTPHDDARLEQQLRRVTRLSHESPTGPEASDSAETEEFAAAWRAFGELLEAGQPASSAAQVVLPLRRRLFWRRMSVGAAIAASLLIGLFVLRSGLNPKSQPGAPSAGDVVKSPAVKTPTVASNRATAPAAAANKTESVWDTTLDTEIAQAPSAAAADDAIDTRGDVSFKLFDRQVASLSRDIESSSL